MSPGRWVALRHRTRRVAADVAVVVAHALVVVTVVAFARLHAFILSIKPLRNDFEQLGPAQLGLTPFVMATCYTAALAHALSLARTARDVVFRHPRRKPRKVAALPSDSECKSANAVRPPTTAKPSSCWKRFLAHGRRTLEVRRTEIAQVRLLVEIALQTFQANKMSGLVATVWLNRLLACVIIANCWFTPIIHAAMQGRSTHAERVARLTADTLLDAVYGFGIPVMIFYPYWRAFDAVQQAFPFDFYVTDSWSTVSVAEMQQLFVSSWTDLVSKASPWFFMSYRLQALRGLVASGHTAPRVLSTTFTSRSRLSRLLDMCLVSWGVGVLALHVRVSLRGERSSMRGCIVAMRPWLATSETCTVMEVSCSQRQIAGQSDEITQALVESDLRQIQALVISHCPALAMPTTIRALSAVTMLKLYNNTIVYWGTEAALSAQTNPVLGQLSFIHTNFSAFPEGLVQLDMATTLRDVKFIATNVTALPLSLGSAWRSVKYFAMDLNPLLTHVPEALAMLPELLFVSLCSNAIQYVPPTLLQNKTMRQIRFVNNPLSELPQCVSRAGSTTSLVVKHTNVSDLPAAWLATKDDPANGAFYVDAEFTPLCEKLKAASGLGLAYAGEWVGRFYVACVELRETYLNVTYPIEEEQSWRQVNLV